MLNLDDIIRNALQEDIHTGDLTTLAVVPEPRQISARLIAKEPLTVAGIAVAARVFALLDQSIVFNSCCRDGQTVEKGALMARMSGDAAPLLQGERVALNLLQRMSGIATLTACYVHAVAGTSARIVDTRKTTPGLRVLENTLCA